MRETKYFTPAEAEKSLPLVKQIVNDILSEGKELKLMAEDLQVKVQSDPRAASIVERINSYIEELSEIGCYYKDWNFETGLIDFPSIINDEEVYLCWRSDEEQIKFYHGVDSGFGGRKEIPKEYFYESN
jgi:hypothetical protein